jgi:hypothetical protein
MHIEFGIRKNACVISDVILEDSPHRDGARANVSISYPSKVTTDAYLDLVRRKKKYVISNVTLKNTPHRDDIKAMYHALYFFRNDS